ncbi:MAG: ATP-binding protein [bacterium]|nr:ATP-binding protein [bacterium]
MTDSTRARLGEMLLKEGIVTQAQLDEALAKKAESGRFLGQCLVELKYIDQHTLISFLVKQCKIPHISLLDYGVEGNLFEYVPQDLCERFNLLPIDKLGKILTVAMVDPLDIEALENVRAACPDLKIKPILCDWNHFDTVTRKLLGKEDEPAEAEVSASTFGLPEERKSAAPPEEEKKPADTAPAADKPGSPETADSVDAAVDALVEEASESVELISEPAKPRAKPAAKPDRGTGQTQAKPPAPAKPSNMETAVGDSVRQAMEDALGPVLAAQRAAAKSGQGVHPDELADMVRGGMQDAIQSAVSGVVAQMQDADRGQGPSHEAVAALVSKSVKEAMGQAMGVMAEQESRIAELTVAVTQASKTAETASAEAAPADNIEPFPGAKPPSRPAAKASKAEMDALEALEGPGLRSRADDRVRALLESQSPLEGYTFDEFYAGKGNAFTLNVGRAIAEQPGGEFTPFFVQGDVGTGKTHFVNAIGHGIMEAHGDLRVGYVSASRFARQLAESIENRELNAFREHFCHWDVWILDDAQYLSGRTEAQEELLHIFDALHHEQRQIIIASARAAENLEDIDKSLLSRFSAGIVAALEPPEREVRMEILAHHATKASAEVTDEVLALLATRIPSDIRRMTGSLRKVIAFASLVGQDITCELANEILSHMGVSDAA